MITKATVVYRCYDKDGALLYVGMTNNWPRRRAAHRCSSDWWPEVSDTRVEVYPDRPSAADGEQHAIRSEAPRFNVAGTADYPGGRRPDRLSGLVAAALLEAKASADAAHAELKAAVRAALTEGSVRQVAATIGISPTTVQAWAKD